MKAHPDNVCGDFYVEDECCTLCGVPQSIAPDLFSVIADETDHCYVRRQPETPGELDRMVQVISQAELACIRYAGTEPSVLVRLSEPGGYPVCDSLVPEPDAHPSRSHWSSVAPTPFVFPESFDRPRAIHRLKRWLSRLLGLSE